jgi:hypothetical protein
MIGYNSRRTYLEPHALLREPSLIFWIISIVDNVGGWVHIGCACKVRTKRLLSRHGQSLLLLLVLLLSEFRTSPSISSLARRTVRYGVIGIHSRPSMPFRSYRYIAHRSLSGRRKDAAGVVLFSFLRGPRLLVHGTRIKHSGRSRSEDAVGR